ncbi:RNA polymerase sigma factor [Dictyobacter aurantiacus]|uniref:ECF RNA polymerase sigma factor SigW n=1 Tax=Dictyobacter aurantiacus TaxID=1936993 RepID=A0A401ZB40_9CHLR|nr:RNA polymerase sigma factor [Dictyobacter aurantiacus]GCE03973.1 ECF RNA polymerase sigma factor SigW [Dictyobacter aurantiacus]
MSESQVAIIAAWQQGDEQAVRTLFNLHYPRLVQLAVLSGLPPEEAKDCAQEAFLRSFEHRNQLRDLTAFPLWFQRITTRHILNTIKARQRHRHVPLDETNELSEDWQRTRIPLPDEIAISTERQEHLWQCVQALPAHYRVPLVLRYYDDLSLREVADILGKREGTIRVLIHRALQRLRATSQETSSLQKLVQFSRQDRLMTSRQAMEAK